MFSLLLLLILSCSTGEKPDVTKPVAVVTIKQPESISKDTIQFFVINHDISAAHYFEAMDSLCEAIGSTYNSSINEYYLVHANPRILDSLQAQDYYIAKRKGVIIEDQKKLIALHRGDSLRIPSASECDSLKRMLQSVVIDVNIPEFILRILVDSLVVHSCPVRVGKNERKYLELAKHEVDLRTPIGDGSIIRIERSPIYMNPVDGHRYKSTRRDDGNYTQLPRIPFLEPIIAGRRSGALIHPTTNLSTLGKPISNGCVGLSEADAWLVYYYAPLGTKVRFRYELKVDRGKDTLHLADIYAQ